LLGSPGCCQGCTGQAGRQAGTGIIDYECIVPTWGEELNIYFFVPVIVGGVGKEIGIVEYMKCVEKRN